MGSYFLDVQYKLQTYAGYLDLLVDIPKLGIHSAVVLLVLPFVGDGYQIQCPVSIRKISCKKRLISGKYGTE